MSPQEVFEDHARRPRHVGKLLNATAVGDVGSIVVGDALRFYIQVSGKAITQAKFQVFNCADQVAAASVLTETVVGKSLSEAKQLSPADLCEHVGGLDLAQLPPRIWAKDGLLAAIAAIEGEVLAGDEEMDPLLCRCFGVSEETVRQSVRVSGCKTVDDVVAATGVGTGCGTCRPDVSKLIDEASAPVAAAPETTPARGPTGRIQTLLKIQRLVASRLMPQWTAAGMHVELWDFDGINVKARVQTEEAQDDAQLQQVRDELAQLIKAEVEPRIEVTIER